MSRGYPSGAIDGVGGCPLGTFNTQSICNEQRECIYLSANHFLMPQISNLETTWEMKLN